MSLLHESCLSKLWLATSEDDTVTEEEQEEEVSKRMVHDISHRVSSCLLLQRKQEPRAKLIAPHDSHQLIIRFFHFTQKCLEGQS